jgi:hypothetical protein
MWTLLEDPFGRKLLTLLTTDHGLPGDPRRTVLLHALQQLRIEADAQGAPALVLRAICSALRSMRTEFPAVFPMVSAACAPAVNHDDAVSSERCAAL